MGRPAAAGAGHRPEVRGQYRPARNGRGPGRARPRDDAGRGGVQDLHHPGDPGQCRTGQGLAGREPVAQADGPSPDRGDGGTGQGRGLGLWPDLCLPRLGRRPLFPVVGGQPVGGGRPWVGCVRAGAERRPGHGCAFPRGGSGVQCPGAAGPGPDLQCRGSRTHGPDRRPLCPRPASAAGLPAAAGDGVERQAGEARRLARRHRHQPDRLRRARHQRPARLLPADPSGADGGSGGVHRRRPHHGGRHGCARGRCAPVVQRPGPGPGADGGQDGGRGPGRADRGGRRRRRGRPSGPAQDLPGRPALDDDPDGRPVARGGRSPDRPL